METARTIGPLVRLAALVSLALFWGGVLAVPAAAEEPQRVREVAELRDSTSKTYELSDRTYEWVGYTEPVHYQDSDGAFQEIDNTVIAEDKQVDARRFLYRNAANGYVARFGTDASGFPAVGVESRGMSLGFILTGAASQTLNRPTGFSGSVLADLLAPEDSVAYPGVYPGVDLYYAAAASGVKEYIVLNDRVELKELAFDLTLQGLKVSETGGRISFVDSQGTPVFWLAEPFAVDGAGVVTKDVVFTLTEADGHQRLTVTLPQSYLADPKRAYPVVIDPTVIVSGSGVTFDSFVSSNYPDQNYRMSPYVRTGRDSTYLTRRTYMKFDLPSIYPSTITAAYLRISKYDGATPQVAGYRVTGIWDPSTVTWNYKPAYSTQDPSTYAYNDSGTWWRMDCKTMVKNWIGYLYSNYGFLLKDHVESGTTQWTTFYSSDAASPNKPELHIVYVYCGNRAYQSVGSGYGQNCMGYAANYLAWLGYDVLGMTIAGINACNTTADLLSYVQSKSQTWMNGHISYNTISGYQSDIGTSQYRMVLRVGWRDMNGDGQLNWAGPDDPTSDLWDYHWWYQTNTGVWAMKQASAASTPVSDSSATTDPYSMAWPGGGYPTFYNSACRYYARNN